MNCTSMVHLYKHLGPGIVVGCDCEGTGEALCKLEAGDRYRCFHNCSVSHRRSFFEDVPPPPTPAGTTPTSSASPASPSPTPTRQRLLPNRHQQQRRHQPPGNRGSVPAKEKWPTIAKSKFAREGHSTGYGCGNACFGFQIVVLVRGSEDPGANQGS